MMNADDVISDITDALEFASPETLLAIYNRADLECSYKVLYFDGSSFIGADCECPAIPVHETDCDNYQAPEPDIDEGEVG